MDKSDLEFSSMIEGSNHYNYSFGYANTSYPNYNTTQKKTLSSTYYLKWSTAENKLQELYETLRFNGLTSIVLSCDYSDELKSKIREELIDKCIENGKVDAQHVAKSMDVTIGNLISYMSYDNFENQQLYTGGNIYYNNSLMRQKHVCTATLSFEIAD